MSLNSEELSKISDFLHRVEKASKDTSVYLDPAGELYVSIIQIGTVATVKAVRVEGEDVRYVLERLT